MVPVAYAAQATGIIWAKGEHGLRPPLGLHGDALTTVTAFATNTSYNVYLGRILNPATSCTLVCNVTTAFVSAGPLPWAEVGILSGTFVTNGNIALFETRGFTDVTTTFNSTGIKATSVTLSGVTPGMDLWASFGSKTTGTVYQVRGLLADDIRTGVFQTAGRPSNPGAGSIAGATIVPPWCGVGDL